MSGTIGDAEYQQLLRVRTELRRFLHWSEEQAAAAGLTPAQHQLLLAVRGHADDRGPTIGEIADVLMLRHHSAVELVDRAESAGLVVRRPDATDQRVVRLALTRTAATRLERLSARHLDELARLAAVLPTLVAGLEAGGGDSSIPQRIS